MCGIAGKIYLDKDRDVLESDIANMVVAINHRGPDDWGVYCHKNIGLGHARLSIIDISPLGHQPMANGAGDVRIVFNGEIYNFKELRDNLIKDGYIFKSKTDTEVIIALYEKYGEDCLQYLRGMFAFAIWDDKNKKLFIARDRIGKKPLNYFFDSNNKIFIFASEIKAILKNKEVKKDVNYEAIDHYLSLQYIPSPFTIFQGIKKLPPAHYLVLQNNQMKIQRYWQIDFNEKLNISENKWKEKVVDKLKEAVSLRMISDVPLGAFLSGGIDSSAVVSIMSELSDNSVKTFSVGFGEVDYNETQFARIIADKFKTEHHEFIVEPKALDILSKLVYYYDEPFADSSAIPTWYLAELTRKHVTVALNGDGGDENFGGYERYIAYKVDILSQQMPCILNNILARKAGKTINSLLHTKLTQKIERFLATNQQDPRANYIGRIFGFTSEQKKYLYSEDFKNKLNNNIVKHSEEILEQLFSDNNAKDVIDKALFVDINSYIPGDLMVKVDIATMAHSLESRSPFLDHEFMELMAKMPSNLKIKGFNKKYILKESLRSMLPSEILDRPKMGFGAPLEQWFRGDLKNLVIDNLLSKKSLDRGLFNEEAVKKLVYDHIDKKANNCYKLWQLLFLEQWFRVWID